MRTRRRRRRRKVRISGFPPSTAAFSPGGAAATPGQRRRRLNIRISGVPPPRRRPSRRLGNSICTVKVLALQLSGPDLNAVLDAPRCFPCLEKLYVNLDKLREIDLKNACQYDPLDQDKCLETHQKNGVEELQRRRARCWLCQVLYFECKSAKGNHIWSQKINKKWVADQHRLLKVETGASRDAQFKFKNGSYYSFCLDTHDLSMADPFNRSFVDGGRCSFRRSISMMPILFTSHFEDDVVI